jgi:hypothetical protein
MNSTVFGKSMTKRFTKSKDRNGTCYEGVGLVERTVEEPDKQDTVDWSLI